MPHILIVEDETIIRSALRRLLERVPTSAVQEVIARVQARSLDPHAAVDVLIDQAEKQA